MIGAGRIAGRRPDAAVLLGHQFLVRQCFVRRVAPELLADALVEPFRKGLGQAIGQRFQHDGAVVVLLVLKRLDACVDADAGGDGERAHVVLHPAALRRDEIRQTEIGSVGGLFVLLAQVVPGHQHLRSRFVGVDLDVVAHAGRRPQAEYAARGEPTTFDDLLQHGLRVAEYVTRRFTDHGVVENLRVTAGEVPGLEERRPVDVTRQLRQVVILQHLATEEFRRGWRDGLPVGLEGVGTCVRDGDQRRALLVGVLQSNLVVIGAQRGDVFLALRAGLRQQAGTHRHRTRGVGHIHGDAGIVRRDLHRRVHARGGRTADQERQLHALAFHFLGEVRHFFQRRRDQAGQADDIRALFPGGIDDLLCRHHHAEVHHSVVVALEHHRYDVLADVVHVALDRGDDDLALGFGRFTRLFGQARFIFLDERDEMRHRLLHDASRLHHLRQEHLAGAEQVADHVHAVHERALDDLDRPATARVDLLTSFLGILDDPLRDAVHHGVRQTCPDLGVAPFQRGRLLGAAGFQCSRQLDQSFGRVAAIGALAIEDHVLDSLAQFCAQVVIHAHHAGVDDAHGHAGADGVVQEHGVDGFARRVVAAEREAHVRHAARHLGVRQVLLDPARGLDEVHAVVVVLLDAGGDGEDVRVEDDVFRREADVLGEQLVGTGADFSLAREGVGLALLVEGHDDDRGAVALAELRLAQELGLAFLHGNRVDDALALHALQAGLDHFPLGGVDHDRHARDVRLGGDQVEEPHHGGLRIEHGLVHVDVDDLRAVLHLLARHRQCLVVLLVQDQARKGLGAGDVGALADVDEQRRVIDVEGLQAGQAQLVAGLCRLPGRQRLDGVGNGADVIRRRAAAATGDVDQPGLGEFLQQARGDVRRFVEAGVTHRIGQPGVRVHADMRFAEVRQFFDVRPHQRCTEGAVQADGERLGVAHRIPERFHRLAGQDAPRGIGHRA